MILVMPNAYTIYQGSMFSNSATTGDWEGYVTHDLVAYIDTHYRTIATPAGRGLAGHSMGGYGTIRLAMKYPDVYSSIYILSACCLTANLNPQGQAFAQAEAVHTQDEAAKLARGPITMLAEAAAWSPNPKNPPFFFDLPVKDGKVQPAVAARWVANAPLAIIDQYISQSQKTARHRNRCRRQRRPLDQQQRAEPDPYAIRPAEHLRNLRRRSHQPHRTACGNESSAVLLNNP